MDASLSQSLVDEFVAAAHGDFEKVKLLLQAQPLLISANASWDELAVEAASQTGRVDIVEYLLERGAQYDICTAAVLGEKERIVDFLDKEPGLIDATGAHRIPLLYFAVIRGHQEIAELLLERGVDINAGTGGNTALHGAVIFGQLEMVAWLLDHGADVLSTDYSGKTPLQVAEENNQENVLALLKQFEQQVD